MYYKYILMGNGKELKDNIINIFTKISDFIANSEKNEEFIRDILILFFNFIFFFKKLCNNIHEIVDEFIEYRDNYGVQIDNILNELITLDQSTIIKYNELYYKNNYIKYNDIISSYENNVKYNKKIKNDAHMAIKLSYNNIIIHNNIELEDIYTLIIPKEKSINEKNNNYNYVDIGYGNKYKLNIYNTIHDNIPLNLLVYIKQLDQIVIKVGNENKYQFINSKLYRVYNPRNKIDNDRSIICNNNIKKYNKKCQNGTRCKYYHDPIIGYEDNYHQTRQFSSNPIIYNCIDFKDGTKVKENVKNIPWPDAVNLYQSSLSVILIACIHSITEN